MYNLVGASHIVNSKLSSGYSMNMLSTASWMLTDPQHTINFDLYKYILFVKPNQYPQDESYSSKLWA